MTAFLSFLFSFFGFESQLLMWLIIVIWANGVNIILEVVSVWTGKRNTLIPINIGVPF